MKARIYAGGGVLKAGVGTAGDFYVPSSSVVAIGSNGAPDTVTKTMRIPHTAAQLGSVLGSTSGNILHYSGMITPATTGIESYAMAGVILPIGATITRVAAKMYRGNVSSTAIARFRRVDEEAGGALLATLTHTTTQWQTVSAVVNEVVGTGSYVFEIELEASTSNLFAGLTFMEVEYTVADYLTTL